MYAYKGFEPDLSCRGYRFVMGKNVTPEANCASNGFHCAEDPLDCLSYTDVIRIRATKIGSFRKKYACTQRKSRRPRCGSRLSASEQLAYFAKKYV